MAETPKKTVVPNIVHTDLHDIPNPPDGHVTVARLAPDGKELDYFVVNERTFNRTYSDPKKYAKKKPTK